MLIISFKVADSYANSILTIVCGNIFFLNLHSLGALAHRTLDDDEGGVQSPQQGI